MSWVETLLNIHSTLRISFPVSGSKKTMLEIFTRRYYNICTKILNYAVVHQKNIAATGSLTRFPVKINTRKLRTHGRKNNMKIYYNNIKYIVMCLMYNDINFIYELFLGKTTKQVYLNFKSSLICIFPYYIILKSYLCGLVALFGRRSYFSK